MSYTNVFNMIVRLTPNKNLEWIWTSQITGETFSDRETAWKYFTEQKKKYETKRGWDWDALYDDVYGKSVTCEACGCTNRRKSVFPPLVMPEHAIPRGGLAASDTQQD